MADDSKNKGLYGSDLAANMVRSATAELVGTFILVFTGTAVAAAAVMGKPIAGEAYSSLAVALAFGFALIAVVAGIGHISGAHVNPAVTFGLFVTGKFPGKYVPVYWVAQFAGAVLGAAATWAVLGDVAHDQAHLGATSLATGVSTLRGFTTEALITFVLVFVVVSVATDDRVHKAVPPLAVGVALTLGVLIGGPVTGGGVNPARAIGPMLVTRWFDNILVFLIAPLIGAAVAALLYDKLLSDAKDPAEAESESHDQDQNRDESNNGDVDLREQRAKSRV